MSIKRKVNYKLYVYTMEFYSAIKQDELRTHATAWMHLETIILSERSQTENILYVPIYVIFNNRQN